jgi:tRNA pseudouridine55 synthase
MATGLMILGVEKGTRLLGHLTGMDKTYEATIRLGMATTTDDAEGEIVTAAGARLDEVGAGVAPSWRL